MTTLKLQNFDLDINEMDAECLEYVMNELRRISNHPSSLAAGISDKMKNDADMIEQYLKTIK